MIIRDQTRGGSVPRIGSKSSKDSELLHFYYTFALLHFTPAPIQRDQPRLGRNWQPRLVRKRSESGWIKQDLTIRGRWSENENQWMNEMLLFIVKMTLTRQLLASSVIARWNKPIELSRWEWRCCSGRVIHSLTGSCPEWGVVGPKKMLAHIYPHSVSN